MGAKFMRPLNERGSAPQGLGGIEIIFVGPVFFALNIDTPNRMDDLFKREAIVRAILRSIEALPPNPAVNSDAAR